MDGYAIDELIEHYVNYRKLISPAGKRLIPEHDLGLFAVTVRYPRGIARQITLFPSGRPGVFGIESGARQIRLIVLGRIVVEPRNAPWQLLSLDPDRVIGALQLYRRRGDEVGALLYPVFRAYLSQRMDMAYTIEQFLRETRKDALKTCLRRSSRHS